MVDRITTTGKPECECEWCGATGEDIVACEECWAKKAIDRLAAYEDTDLMPDEVGKLIPPAIARRILRNCLSMATKRYQERNTNWAKVRDYLLYGRATKQKVSMAACVAECERIGVDPYAFEIDGEGD